MFKEMGVKPFYIFKSFDDPDCATVIFQGPKNVFYDIFINLERKPIFDASEHIYESTRITRLIFSSEFVMSRNVLFLVLIMVMPQSTLESLLFFLILSLLATYIVNLKYSSKLKIQK